MDENQLEAELMRLFNIIRPSQVLNRERTKALNHFLILCQQSLKLIKDKHPDYSEALNKTWVWLGKNIQDFQPSSSSLRESLERWINGYLYWRIKDLYIPNDDKKIPTFSIDQPIGEKRYSLTYKDLLIDNNQESSLLDKLIIDEEAEHIKNVIEKIRLYVEQDPDSIFRNLHPKKYPKCNCQLLITRLIFKEPPNSLADIAREYDIKYQNLNTCWQHTQRPNCRKLLKEIAYKIYKDNYYQSEVKL
ncbi:hypothetical protein [Nodularia spumigena]|uniref:hypothetical protein n=1 Tax=Nodularia spumigena TaxID=70799 RepID=UPI00232EC541|nr:hypothetical protein [Nodularia spumigena]MDB9316618.1 hypothetical protein [Nodularia spumigena CS-590/01A]MDB9326647.1 hypothetical protein [Nodularia spumigena CS-590/02]MDB9334144.1 hypothetical protein [Nodularia spumigena CS-590/01]MDB9347003.1 hypothetical protein [Nodularia spumigena CS-588/01]MDB9353988.1 hypothetical protein [Nodularia spumigena CS-588/05]